MERNHLCNCGRVHHEEQFCEIIFNFGSVVGEEMSSKDISYLELWWPFFFGGAEPLGNVGKVHHEEPLCENIYMNLDQ